MPKHGTAYELGQYNEVLVAVTRALPKALDGTDPKIVIAGLENRGEALGLALHGAIIQVATTETEQIMIAPAIPPYPAVGVEFELKLDFDAPEADPIAMVRADGYGSPEKWKFTGRKGSGIQTRCFKLVRVGACRDLDEVRQKLAQYGEAPEGQWREAFKAAYPKPDGQGPVGFADPSWVSPSGDVRFPFVRSVGGSLFVWAVDELGVNWRWLVPAGK